MNYHLVNVLDWNQTGVEEGQKTIYKLHIVYILRLFSMKHSVLELVTCRCRCQIRNNHFTPGSQGLFVNNNLWGPRATPDSNYIKTTTMSGTICSFILSCHVCEWRTSLDKCMKMTVKAHHWYEKKQQNLDIHCINMSYHATGSGNLRRQY